MLRMSMGTNWALAPRPRAGRRNGVAIRMALWHAHAAEFGRRVVALGVVRLPGLPCGACLGLDTLKHLWT